VRTPNLALLSRDDCPPSLHAEEREAAKRRQAIHFRVTATFYIPTGTNQGVPGIREHILRH
jgi:hypothetical protein